MAIYSREDRLSDILMKHPALIPVIGRIGINLGVGDASIEEVCKEKDIDLQFFLSIINTYIDEEYIPVFSKNILSIDKLVDYLEKTGEYYCRLQIPNIENHFNGLIKRSGSDNNLEHLRTFFIGMKHQLEEMIQQENEKFFPLIRKKEFKEVSIEELIKNGREVEDKLEDLLTFFVVHLKGNYDHNLCLAVVTAIFSLRKDMNQNNRIRSRILCPMISDISSGNY